MCKQKAGGENAIAKISGGEHAVAKISRTAPFSMSSFTHLFRMRNTKPTFTPATFVGLFARVEAWFLLSGYTTLSLRRAATQAPDCKSFNPSRSLAIVFLYVFCFYLDTLRPGPVVRATDVERIRLAPGRIVCSRAVAAPSFFPFVAGPRSATYSLHVNRQTLFSRATVLSLGRLWRKGIHPGSAAYCFAVINASPPYLDSHGSEVLRRSVFNCMTPVGLVGRRATAGPFLTAALQ